MARTKRLGKIKLSRAGLARELRRQARSPRLRYLVITAAVALAAEHLTRTARTGAWRLVRDEDPPRNPERLDVGWADAIAWTALTGLGMAAAGLLARRGAAIGWKRYSGRPIPAGAGRA